jgi:hypothetical protein
VNRPYGFVHDFRPHKPTDKSKFEIQISSSWYTKTGFIKQTSTFACRGVPAQNLKGKFNLNKG